jgi:hypothetical protein
MEDQVLGDRFYTSNQRTARHCGHRQQDGAHSLAAADDG